MSDKNDDDEGNVDDDDDDEEDAAAAAAAAPATIAPAVAVATTQTKPDHNTTNHGTIRPEGLDAIETTRGDAIGRQE